MSSDLATNTELRTLPLGAIMPSPLNPRKAFAAEALAELAESIGRHGVQQPIVVRDLVAGDGPRYEIIMGERRWRAAAIAGMETIPAIVRQGVDDKTLLELAVAENIHRNDLNPIEEAQAFRTLMDLGDKQDAIAQRVGRSQEAISNRVRLLKLPPEVQVQIAAGELTASHGMALLRFPATAAPALAKALISDGLPVTALESEQKPMDYNLANRLEADKVGKSLGWGYAPFDAKAICTKCPHGAYVGDKEGHGICLRPDHYAELEREAKKAASDAAAETVRAFREQNPGLPDSIVEWNYNKMVEIPKKAPAGCSAECKCRAIALMRQYIGSDSKMVPHLVCTDIGCFQKLMGAAHAEKQDKRKAKWDSRLAEAVKALQEQPHRRLIMLIVCGWERLPYTRKEAMLKSLGIECAQYEADKHVGELLRALDDPANDSGEIYAQVARALLENEAANKISGYDNLQKALFIDFMLEQA